MSPGSDESSIAGRTGLRRRVRQLVAARLPALTRRRRLRRERLFYGRWLPSGGLCFDVGACHGKVADMLLQHAGRVVAVEADPDLAAALQRRYADEPRLVVEAVAVGPHAGHATLRRAAADGLADAAAVGTLSTAFRDAFPELGHATGSEVEVPQTTLDALIARHGVPEFLKIDVEGYECEVLAGLHAAPRGLCFEVVAPLLERAEAAVALIDALGRYRFAFSPYEELAFADPMLPAAAFLPRLRARCGPNAAVCGDVYAERVD